MEVSIIYNEVVYWDTSPLAETPTVSYPLGAGFLEFLEIDFTRQELARLEMLQRYKNCAAAPGELWTSALAVYMMYEPESPREHPYIKYLSPPGEPFDGATHLLLKDLADFTALQKKYCAAAQFCFDVDFSTALAPLSSLQRYFLYDYGQDEPLQDDYQQAKVTFSLKPGFYDTIDNLNKRTEMVQASKAQHKKKPLSISSEMVDHVKLLDVQGGFTYLNPTMADLAYLEFTHMVQSNLKIRKCGNCGRYFIVKGNYDGKFCDRVLEGKAQNCQTVGALKLYRAKLAEDSALIAYERAYKRNYARRRKGRLAPDSFETWSRLAQKKRMEYKNGALSRAALSQWVSQEPEVVINAETQA